MAIVRAFCLTIHAQYQCRHAGACCHKWTIPAEPQVVELVERHGLRPSGMNGPLFVSSGKPDRKPTMNVAKGNNGRCVFFEQDPAGSCVIHRQAGPSALPAACRHFPRKFLRDGRGTFVSLSHFCPTAASMLLDPQPLGIVDAAPPLVLEEPIEGLDAREALPPLLRSDVLCDLEGYDAWEREAIAVLADPDFDCDEALERIASATERVRRWRPGGTSLAEHVRAVFADREDCAASPSLPDDELLRLLRRLTDGIPRAGPAAAKGDARERAEASLRDHDLAMKNYVAARLFANWIAYQGRGLRSVVQWARTAAALVRHHAIERALRTPRAPGRDDFIEAVRKADLLLLHGMETQAFARAVAPLEGAA